MRDSVYAAKKDRAVASLIARTLRKHHGNKTQAARSLGIDRTYFQQLVKKYNLEA